MNMDSDGEREDDEERQKSVFQAACPEEETDDPRLRLPCPRTRVRSMVTKATVAHYKY